jgi:large subunit ribosomal protein L9
MRVILRADVDGLGNAGDVIDVANGFARNYLVPQGLALRATDGTMSQAAAMQRSRDARDAKDRESAEDIARQLVPLTISISARVGSGDQLYGSVTTTDVAEAVKSQTGIDIERRKMSIEEPIRTVGSHQVGVRLHADVQFALNVDVSPQT